MAMTTEVSKTDTNALDFIDKLQADQQVWHSGLYASANEKLLALLADCLLAYSKLRDDRRALKVFKIRAKDLSIPFNAGTHLASIVVRYVFRIHNSRAAVYARVLRAALDEKIAPEQLPAWVTNVGGIENVQRPSKSNMSATQQRDADVDDAVELLLESAALTTLEASAADLTPDTSAGMPFSLVLVRSGPSGDFEVVRCVRNTSLLRQVLAREAKALRAENDNATAAAQQSAKLADSVAIVTAAATPSEPDQADVAA